ncbi:disintegrin and metalloproteinase domain-containing protein 9-like [Rhinatrema bivittatum]|uniref:disintegrin and metalloproteinase domain-containing protein 9-like n=1 Tax=Rhinatrema bivittatum TaxID=194408 RepID=UPI00112E9244|nr:disintegrin and metalloproteinase domain-containing protein 9-like [Rhinatrema bivittatum]
MSALYLLLIILGLTFSGHLVLAEGALSEQESSLPDYEIIIPQRNKQHTTATDGRTQDDREDTLSYSIQVAGRILTLKLKRNKKLISEGFTIYTYNKDGKLEISKSKTQVNCYYQGFIEGVESSVVALSICHGLRGVIRGGDWYYGIEPLVASSLDEHLLFRLPALPGKSFGCGVQGPDLFHKSNLSMGSFHGMKDFLTISRLKREVMPVASFVELCIVVDKNRYNEKNGNQSAVKEDVLELVNAVDMMFQPLNIKIVLTGLLIWSNGNPIEVLNGTAGDVLGRFSSWRGSENGLKRSDISHLLIGRNSFNGVVGMAYVGTVCSPTLGSSISTVNTAAAVSQAEVVAHELGHNLGMNHDDTRCPGHDYIMNSVEKNTKMFSTCSADDFENLILKGGGLCLKNPPNPSDVVTDPVCGNQVVDSNEECDCGPVQVCQNPCCNATTCKLTPGSQCAQGLCCEQCKFKVSGMVCRAKSNECDLPEYCNGSYALCPIDVYIMNGYPCNSSRAYCYNGICQSYNSQCQALFGEGAIKAIDKCFQEANIRGDRTGNCGMSGGNYKRCTVADSLCGKLNCQNVTKNLDATVSTFLIEGTQCTSADFDLGTDVPDPGLVHQGSPCADGKISGNLEEFTELNWREDNLVAIFLEGLLGKIKDELAAQGLPTHWRLIALTSKIDCCLQRRAWETHPAHRSFTLVML